MIKITLKTQPEGYVSPMPRHMAADLMRQAAAWLDTLEPPKNAFEHVRTLNLMWGGEAMGQAVLTECLPGCLLYEGHDGECIVV